MPDQNKVLRDKEHIPYLAHGLYNNWRNLWNKNAALAGKRKNPLILFHGDKDPSKTHQDPAFPTDPSKTLPGAEGDTVVLPDPSEKSASGAVDSHNPFTTQSDKVFLRLRVLDEEFQSFKDATWMLYVDGIKHPKGAAEGKFAADGTIHLEVPKTAQVGRLVMSFPAPPEPPAESDDASSPAAADGAKTGTTAAKTPPAPAGDRRVQVVVWLEIGRLDPIQEQAPDDKCLSGVQQRLNNLGFNAGFVDGVDGPHCQAAIRRFQRRFLPNNVNGTSDAATQAKLHELHDEPAVPPKPAKSDASAAPAAQSGPSVGQPATTPPAGAARTQDAVAQAAARYEQAVKETVDAARANQAAQSAKDAAFQKWKNDRNNRRLKEDYEAKREHANKTEAAEAHSRKKMERAKKDLDQTRANKSA